MKKAEIIKEIEKHKMVRKHYKANSRIYRTISQRIYRLQLKLRRGG